MHHQLLTSIIDQIPVALLVTDPNGKAIWSSQVLRDHWSALGFQQAFQQPAEGFDMSTLSVYRMDGTPLPHDCWPLVRTVRTLEVVKKEMMKIELENKWVYIEVSTSPILNSEGNCEYVYLICDDVTAKIQREENLHLMKVQTEFLAKMSHELRTPMYGILGMLDVMTALNSEQEHHLGVMKRSANNLLKTLNDILDFSKLEADRVQLDYSFFNIRHLLEDTVYAFSTTSSSTIDLYVSDRIPTLMYSDPHRITQCINNLVLNAIKFVDPAGSGKSQVTVKADLVDSQIVVKVADQGIGMSDDTMEKVFSPFAQAHSGITRIYGGTGLGLPISKHLAKCLGGDITVESELGKGSVFSLWLPLREPEKGIVQTSKVLKRKAEYVSKTTRISTDLKILLAEDNPINKIVTIAQLKKNGFTNVHCVENGLEVLEAIDNQPDFDLLLLDIQMPKLGGHDTCRILRSKKWDKPIIALTASAMERDRTLCLEAGMSDYMSKPFQPEDFKEKITRWCSVM